jgi:hypothetical protein
MSKEGWRYDQIAGLFRLLPDDIQAAIQYIEAHYAEVMADYQQILARHSACGDPFAGGSPRCGAVPRDRTPLSSLTEQYTSLTSYYQSHG